MPRAFKSHASSSRAVSGGFGGFGSSATTTLSYLSEPPSLVTISDPNVVVAFKNLLKKDSITKTRGLEDFKAYVQAHPFEQDGGVEEAVLDAWVKQYPRISIDNSRRVRELSHSLQYELLKSTRKRMEKHIPHIVGAWLAGTYDRDRPVSRAANDGLTSFLDSPQKMTAFWRKCQPQILQYAQEAIHETSETLSDERTTNKDDAQAKYNRVIAASLSLVVNLLLKLQNEDVLKCKESYENFLVGNPTLWKLSGSDDPLVRRTLHRLLTIILQKQENFIVHDDTFLGGEYVSEGLKTSQSGSAMAFVEALVLLTSKLPDVWNSLSKGKRSASTKLRKFIEKGSQSSPAEFWQAWTSLLQRLPAGILPEDTEGLLDLLKAQRLGISSREELRSNLAVAWASYFDVVSLALSIGSRDSGRRQAICVAAVYPVFEQYVRSEADNAGFSCPDPATLAHAFAICASEGNGKDLKAEWHRLNEIVILTILTSLPAQSKDYAKSQASVLAAGQRWMLLQDEILSLRRGDNDLIPDVSTEMVIQATGTLKSRNGKPYGAAGVLEYILRSCPTVVAQVNSVSKTIAAFLEAELPRLIVSPSGPLLVGTLAHLSELIDQVENVEAIWQSTVDGILAIEDAAPKNAALKTMLSCGNFHKFSQEDAGLQAHLIHSAEQVLHNDVDAVGLFETAITSHSFNTVTAEHIASMAVDALSAENSDASLHIIELLATADNRPFNEPGLHLSLMTKLLAIGEISNNMTRARVDALRAVVDGPPGTSTSTSPVFAILLESLEKAGPQSLSITTLVNQASDAFASGGQSSFTQLFPDPESWMLSTLKPLLPLLLNPTISMTNPLGGAVDLIRPSFDDSLIKPGRDLKGYSVAFRKALYTTKLISKDIGFSSLELDAQAQLLQILAITAELANDQFSLQKSNLLWTTISDPEVAEEIQNFITETQRTTFSYLHDNSRWREVKNPDTLGPALLQNLLLTSQQEGPLAFYAARALSAALTYAVEVNGWQTAGGEDWLKEFAALSSSAPHPFTTLAVLTGLKETLESSKAVNTFCNRLISDIAGTDVKSAKALRLLVMLNATMAVYEVGDLPVAQNRLVFAVKQITSWMANETVLTSELVTEALRSLHRLLPCIPGVYGSHWSISLQFAVSFIDSPVNDRRIDALMPAYHASLKLFGTCRKILSDTDQEEKNDDVEEALTDASKHLPTALLNLLRLPRKQENQPWQIFDELLGRELATVPIKALGNNSDLFPLLASDFRLVQTSAFDILHRLAAIQAEDINFDAALDKKDAALPEELSSLLLDAPSLDRYSEEDLVQFPALIRSYLLSWHVVFDYFVNASYKVRSDYSNNLQADDTLAPLLDFTFDFLGHSIGRPLDLEATRISPSLIRDYSPAAAAAETPEYDMQWLLAHLYYQCLRYLPSLTKSWWRDCKSKQTRLAVETWTERFLSPLIVSDTLDDVLAWSSNQDSSSSDDKELIIKISRSAREITAGYEVDDLLASIKISLLPPFPLGGVSVESLNRVAVSEKKWRSWLMITQGVIYFSNGSITDGLATFKRNIVGALKGQTECAICYSIVSSDRKMPEKRCQTCKHLFHAGCLFKWFASSNQSSCPLCRNPFTYGDTPRKGGRAE